MTNNDEVLQVIKIANKNKLTDLTLKEIKILPSEIGQLTNLQTLDLSQSQLSSLPP